MLVDTDDLYVVVVVKAADQSGDDVEDDSASTLCEKACIMFSSSLGLTTGRFTLDVDGVEHSTAVNDDEEVRERLVRQWHMDVIA